jgi:alkanesulfonate monooxygenase SsuD/methylene tetrahydromethanopterin reductase-like flavin-dependent oxidoreductase (luciferase family)
VLARAPKLFAIRIANNFEAEKTIKTGYVPFVTATDASQSDLQLYHEAMALAAMAEPLGFDSLWSLEHHFTGYAMTPSPVQFLSYFAGHSRKIQLGTAVVVLPWHDPVRIAEKSRCST